MKSKKIIRLLCVLLSVMLVLSACGSKQDTNENKDNKVENQDDKSTEKQNDTDQPVTSVPEDDKPDNENVSDNENVPDNDISDTSEQNDDAEKLSFFESVPVETERMIREAVEQYNNEDYTALSEPVKYNVLWLGFTHVTYGDLDFQMTDFDKEYLQAVALNYEKTLESITNHSLDITVDLHFIDDVAPLTKSYNEDWLYLAQETVQPVIDKYILGSGIDTVLATVQTAGDENRSRNENKEGFGVHDVILGLMTAGMDSTIGYSTINLGMPVEGTYPLADPEIPSLYATAVAVHEWMHQLEYMGKLLNIEYPPTHAYFGPDDFPGYQKFTADENDYDFFEFYKLVLQGKLPYTTGDTVKHVGMYPKMWPLIKRNVYNLGQYTIKASDGQGYLNGREDEPRLFISEDECTWNIKYIGDGKFMFSPLKMPDKLIDLGNAWDIEDNSISLWIYTGYIDAQSWRIIDNKDGSYSLQTPYESGRLFTVRGENGAFLCSSGTAGVQKWYIDPVSYEDK